MSKVVLMSHQQTAMETLNGFQNTAYYLDCGLGKTFVGSEQIMRFNNDCTVLVCPKSLIPVWKKHFETFYPDVPINDCTKKRQIINGINLINYDLIWRRPEFLMLKDFTLCLDESSLIQNETAKRSKFVLKLQAKNNILLSGTPVSGSKYEKLWSQCRLLGWGIKKKDFYSRYIIEREIKIKNSPFPLKIVAGYKNVEELKFLLKHHGAYFLKAEEVLNLPAQNFIPVEIETSSAYQKFRKHKIVEIDGETLIGENVLTQMLYERQLCGQYSKNKLEAFADLIETSDERWIVFYSFNAELEKLKSIVKGRPISIVNGDTKDLTAYENDENSITFIQYQAGSHGLTLTKSNKMIYYSPPMSCEHWQQSQKRIHRISQDRPCFYYIMLCQNSVETKIKKALDRGVDFNNRLFEEE